MAGRMGDGAAMKSQEPMRAMMEMMRGMESMQGMPGMEGMAEMPEHCRQMMAGASADDARRDK